MHKRWVAIEPRSATALPIARTALSVDSRESPDSTESVTASEIRLAEAWSDALATGGTDIPSVQDTINGSAGGDTLVGTAGDDLINGLAGNDSITAGGGNDTLDGGAGVDTAAYAGLVGSFGFGLDANDRLLVIDLNPINSGDEGTDALVSIERAGFSDALLELVRFREAQVNTYATNAQNQAAVAALNDGGYVVTWGSEGQDGSFYGVYSQRFDAGGQPAGTETRVNSTSAGYQLDPAVTGLGNGGHVVVWTSDGDGGGYGVYMQRYAVGGGAVGIETRVNTSTAGNQQKASVAALSTGFVVVWESAAQDGSGTGIYLQRFDGNGVAAGVETRVNSYLAGDQATPGVAGLAGGGFAVVWKSALQDGSGNGIYAQRFAADGTPLGSEFRVNGYTFSEQTEPAIGRLADGGFVVVWQSDAQDGDGWGIYAQRFDAGGIHVGSETLVNTRTLDHQWYPTVSGLADGGYLVGWTSDPQQGTGSDVFAQRFDARSERVGAEFRVNTQLGDAQNFPAAVGLADGGYLFAWSSNAQDGSSAGVFAQRYSEHGSTTLLRDDATGHLLFWNDSEDIGLEGGGGNDRLQGTGGDMTLDGGAGTDTVDLVGAVDESVFTGGAGDRILVTETIGGSNTLIDVEVVEFTDATVGVERLREVALNTTTAGWQEAPALAARADGGFVAAWVSQGIVTTQQFTASGATTGVEEPAGTSFQGYRPSIAVLADGGHVVTWHSYHFDANDYDIWFQRFGADGGAIGSEVRANTQLAGNQIDADVVALPDGGFLAVWTSSSDVFARRFDATGAAAGDEFRVNDFAASNQSASAVAVLESGQYVVVWESGGQDGSGYSIHAQRFALDGARIGEELRCNTYTSGDQRTPDVAALADGGFVVSWVSDGQDGSGTGIFAQRFSASGVPVGAEARINTYAYDDQDGVAVAALLDGGYAVTWRSVGPSGGYDWHFVQRFDASGNAVGAEQQVNTAVLGAANFPDVPAIAALTTGEYLVAWEVYDGSNVKDIHAQRYAANGGTTLLRALAGQVDLQWAGSANISLQGSALNDTLRGGDATDVLDGAAGNDSLIGGAGADLLRGGAGDDTFLIEGSDQLTELPGQGVDTVQVTGSWTLGAELERLVLGGTGAVDGTGNVLANQLSGNSGNNRLDGKAGADTLAGGAGDDVYIVDASGDTITESSGEGTDTAYSGAAFTLASNVEHLVLTGFAAVAGTGNALPNTLTGNPAGNSLNGGGGADTLAGGPGDDIYTVDNPGDLVTEALGEGVDGVHSSVSWSLGEHLENLTLAGSSALAATGNELANRLTGNTGANTLDGAAGADTLVGGAGSDTYVVDSDGDSVQEALGEGTDSVLSSTNFTLSGNLEILQLTGATNINATGNSIANALTGNSGSNTLLGLSGNDTMTGGGSADALIGGAGDDLYVVDAADVLTEESGEGIDTVQSSATWTLGTNFENLVLTGSAAGGVGNSLGNVLNGNNGANSLDGAAGADTLVGGTGDDTYQVDDAGDVVTESPDTLNGGVDRVVSTVSYTLGAHQEQLELAGSAPIDGAGNALANSMTGNAAANVLDGGAGVDTLAGGAGDDTYVIGSPGESVSEGAGAGFDRVQSAVNHTLGTNLEALLLTGAAALTGTGNTAANDLTGNTGANTLSGGAGHDTLDGGDGADSLVGGTGDDLYITDGADTLAENAGEGTDTVQSTASHTLGANFERLVLSGNGNTAGTGNAEANHILGNSGANTMAGAAGADTLVGGDGNDTYTIDATDTVTELADEGIDTVRIAASWTLQANIERLTLLGGDAFRGIGNTLDNTITGNGGSNSLDGGVGADTLTGGAGDDVYVFDDEGDAAIEGAGAGTDTLRSRVAITTLPDHVEVLDLGGNTTAIDGYGNALANQLIGNVLGNDLDGGAGADTLSGQKGDDSYYVDDAGDRVVERIGEGVDIVIAVLSFTLPANVEELKLEAGAAINGKGNARSNYLEGNGSANVLDGGLSDDVLVGLGGDDTYIVDFAEDVVIEDADEGADTVESSVSYTLPENVENLVLTGAGHIDGTGNGLANVITGNAGNNGIAGLAGDDTLDGGDGNDMLDGGTGADAMTGGAGDDTYVVDNAGDTVTELPGEGRDLVQSSRSYSLGANIENLMLTGIGNLVGNGNTLSNQLIGNDGDNTLRGYEGDDLLKGGDTLDGTSGEDALIGGTGNDVYYVDSAGDVVTELAGGGTDSVYTIYNGYVLPDNVENVVYFDPLVLFVTGNGLNNYFTGNDGDNTLDGAGGADTLAGGGGNDTYVVESTGDKVIEAGDAGTDIVQSSVDYTLTGNVENLALTGTALSGTGNTLDNTVEGNAESNELDGGMGVDTMSGGDGDDVYYVDDADDEVIEAPAAALAAALGGKPGPQAGGTNIDTVISQVSYTLRANIENLELAGSAGKIDGIGNELDNLITGNGSANVLRGMDGVDILDGGGGNDTLDGGTGKDTLGGGTGDDTYVVSAGDAVLEFGGEGEDTVQSAVNWVLAAQLEHLTLTGTGAVSGTGNTLGNRLSGNGGANTLRGVDGNDTLSGGAGVDVLSGGVGTDLLTGGTGADAFLFDAALAGNLDTLSDFARGTDTIRLDDDVFTAFTAGVAVLDTQIRAGAGFTTATTAEHRLIYNSTTGTLYYDADGTGATAAVKFAVLSTLPGTLGAGDFVVVG